MLGVKVLFHQVDKIGYMFLQGELCYSIFIGIPEEKVKDRLEHYLMCGLIIVKRLAEL